jgi:type III secretion protein U
MAEKTQKPTPKRKRDSQKKGQIAFVPAFPKLLVAVGMIEFLLATRDKWVNALLALVNAPFSALPALQQGDAMSVTMAVVLPLLQQAAGLVLIAGIITSVCAILGTVLHTGFVFAPDVFEDCWSRLDPTSNAKEVFSPEHLIQVPQNVLKVAVIIFAAGFGIYFGLHPLLHLADASLLMAFNSVLDLIASVERACALALVLLIAVDVAVKRRFNIKQMMMSHQEVHDEWKEQYGDKHVKRDRKRMSDDLLQMQLTERTRKANAVVTNPTHFAVALYYAAGRTPLPAVLARGTGHNARLMVRVARESGIPIVRSPQLARKLYSVGREFAFIPREALHAVAAVYRTILEVSERGGNLGEVIEINEAGQRKAVARDAPGAIGT